MKFDIGDQIVVRLTNEDGKVVGLVDAEHYLVEVRGVRFPAHEKQLDFPYFKMFSAKKPTEAPSPAAAPKKKYIDQVRPEKKAPRYQVAPGVWLLCMPVFYADEFGDEVVDKLKVYLVNQTNEPLQFKAWFRLKQTIQMDLSNQVASLADFYLLDIDFEDINESPVIDFEFSLTVADKQRVDYYEASYKPKGKAIFKQIEQIKTTGEAFFMVSLFESYPLKQALPDRESNTGSGHPASLDKLKQAGFKVVQGRRISGELPPQTVLDLHIEKLTESYSHMTSGEKLGLQLRTFEQWLDKLQEHYVTQAWVIHGVGTGKLRDEVHQVLRRRDGIKTFVHQFHPWYGHGATEIYFD